MKKLLSIITTAVMLITPLTAAYSDGDIRVTLDGGELAFDVPPQIIDGRTMVPMRKIFEALGAEVEWSGELQFIEAYKQDKVIQMFIGNNMMSVMEGDSPFADFIELDVPPLIVDDRTLVPVRAVSEALDCNVKWDGENQTVIITSAQTETTSEPETTTEPIPEPSEAPQEPTAPLKYQIEYDDTNERQSHNIRDFKITSIEKNAAGDYDITYTMRTFFEGRGDVTANFRCLDAGGAEVDNFGGVFRGTDYTWSWHTAQAAISGKTEKIELVLN